MLFIYLTKWGKYDRDRNTIWGKMLCDRNKNILTFRFDRVRRPGGSQIGTTPLLLLCELTVPMLEACPSDVIFNVQLFTQFIKCE